MDIDLIRDYIADRRDELARQPEKFQILKRHVQAEKARDAILAADPKICQAFIRIDRVFPGEPVRLFGQDVPSVAHNRISIHLGADDPETGERAPGRALLSCLVSEESLSNLMFNQNQGETKCWMTAETALGWALGPFPENSRTTDNLQTAERIAKTADVALRSIEEMTDRIRRAKLPWTKTFRDEVFRTLNGQQAAGEFDFHLKLHLEAQQQQQVQAQVEAAHMALHMSSVLAARTQLLLAPPERIDRGPGEFEAERLQNPMLGALMERIDEDERAVFLEVIHHGMRKFCERIGCAFSPDAIPEDRSVRSSIGFSSFSDALMKEWTQLSEMHKQITNPHRIAARRARSPWMLMARLSSVSGSSEGLHSEFSRLGSHFHHLTISVAQEHNDFGTRRLRDLKDIVSIELTSEDLMTAFRGHPSGDFTRCTLRNLFGAPVSRAPYRNRFDKTVAGATTATSSGIDEEVRSLIAIVKVRISEGIRTAADKDRLLLDLETLVSTHRRMIEEKSARSLCAAEEITDMVRDDIRQALCGVMAQIAPDHEDVSDLLGPAS